jgi:phosphotransferase system  glucose/maltose/N-acetylglucosamine-specific IIC component
MVTPIINGMSDHDAQLLKISTDYSHVHTHKFKTIRKINKYTISDFINKLSYKSWDTIFNSEDVNIMFNSFLNIYLRTLYSSFPLKKVMNLIIIIIIIIITTTTITITTTTTIIIIKTGSLWASKHHADIREICTLHAEIVIIWN